MKENKIFYLCNKKACKKCDKKHCNHTSNIKFAENFKQFEDGTERYIEDLNEHDMQLLKNYNDDLIYQLKYNDKLTKQEIKNAITTINKYLKTKGFTI